jgi:aminoglycoside phosphotransferase (APT) family kinase protein
VRSFHGDAHPGNARGPGSAPVLLDWDDSGAGRPARDLAHLVAHLSPADAAHVLSGAADRWRRAVPGSDAAAAARLAAPVDVLTGAIAWQGFLDRVEPDERPYHDGDPAAGVRAALRRACP